MRMNSLRGACAVFVSAVLVASAFATRAFAQGAQPWPDERQILWQRNLDDALALSKAEHRPLLVVLNMDGESACERIVRERYRDPKFVASTRPFVCVIGTVFRHNPRDYDDEGKRIPCPRLGEITCGEHIALEPAIFDGYLAKDHERVAPRHALITPEGTKLWDRYLLFDLRELDAQLASSAKDAPPVPADGPTEISSHAKRWSEVASGRTQRARADFERVLPLTIDDQAFAAMLAWVREHGDAGSVDALHIAIARARNGSERIAKEILSTARALKLEQPVAEIARGFITGLGRYPGAATPSGEEHLLPLLAELDGKSARTRSLLLACAVTNAYGTPAERALHDLPVNAQLKHDVNFISVLDGLGDAGLTPEQITAAHAAPWVEAPLLVAEDFERELERLEPRVQAQDADAQTLAAYGLASLGLARRRIEAQKPGANLLLEDADHWLQKAVEHAPGTSPDERCRWLLARARANYLLGRFEQQHTLATQAVFVIGEGDASTLPAGSSRDFAGLHADARVVEAMRWAGDASARLIEARAGKDALVERTGMQSAITELRFVVDSPHAKSDDWISLASCFGALGLWREELAVLQEGADRMPAAQDLRTALNASLWNGGRIDLAPAKADWIAARHPESADAAWFAGFAWILQGESLRRGEQPAQSVAAYTEAQARFETTKKLNADYADTSTHYIAYAWLGRGFAHLIADQRAEAADALAHAIRTKPGIATVRDGLDREVVDLVDQSLEWRESGPSPVDALALLDQLQAADPANAFWPTSVSDSELREALRADGRDGKKAKHTLVHPDGTNEEVEVSLPTKDGDVYLAHSLEAARRLLKLGDTPAHKRPLAQAATVTAERALERGELVLARTSLAEAAPLLGFEPPAANADAAALNALALQLRAQLGEARPIFRPGR